MIDRHELRTLYATACHGAAAPARTLARQTLELMLLRAGLSMRDAFKDNGLCPGDYIVAKHIDSK